MKKLKIKRNFKPLACKDGDELYANGIFHFNITQLTAFIKNSPDQFPVENTEVKGIRLHVSDALNEETIANADLSNPIILAEISPDRFNVIDGNHRLEKAHRNGKSHVPAYRIRPEQHVAFLKTELAYRTYVKYWNGKVDERAR